MALTDACDTTDDGMEENRWTYRIDIDAHSGALSAGLSGGQKVRQGGIFEGGLRLWRSRQARAIQGAPTWRCRHFGGHAWASHRHDPHEGNPFAGRLLRCAR